MESEYCIDENVSLHVYPSNYTVEDVIMNKIEANDRNDKEDPFFVVNLGRVEYLYSHVSYTLYKVAWAINQYLIDYSI